MNVARGGLDGPIHPPLFCDDCPLRKVLPPEWNWRSTHPRVFRKDR